MSMNFNRWTWEREGVGKIGTTRSHAEVLSGHTAVVWITGCVGCVCLSHVEPLPPGEGEKGKTK